MPTDAHGNFVGKRLVIFGAGYVGGAVAAEAVVRRMRVTALTRNESKAAALREVGVETVVADLATEAWHEQIAGGADFVLNCVSSGGRELAGYEQSYFAGMNSIVAYVMEWGTVAFVVEALVRHFGERPFSSFGEVYQPLVLGGAALLVLWGVLFWMYRQRLFVKI